MAAAMLQLQSSIIASSFTPPLLCHSNSTTGSHYSWNKRTCPCFPAGASTRRKASRIVRANASGAFGPNKVFLFSNSNSDLQSISATSSSSSSSAETASENIPTIELEFYGPDAKDGTVQPDKAVVESGAKVLRNIMLDSKLELYDLYGKLMNCGGGGSCGTCIVEILEGNDLLSERTVAENRYLKKKPPSWRLACQTIVGDKNNSGKVIVQRLPQKKKY